MGLTGVPLVDAAMKELWSSGWMHNRSVAINTVNLFPGVYPLKARLLNMPGPPYHDSKFVNLATLHCCRLRVICGEFAVKHLLLPWQWGLKHFWDALLDADLESDALGWQYVAGGMNDAPDFGTMLDITAEAAAFDPDGEYVRRWVPGWGFAIRRL